MVIIHGRHLELAMCLGHRQGTGCYHRSRYTQKRVNWEKWQLCMKCARILHPEFYKGKKNHGVRTVPENSQYSKVPFGIVSMPSSE